MRLSRVMKAKITCAVLLCVVFLFAGLFWYFRVYTKTPEYALRSIESALEHHDSALFFRYVRLDALLDTGYDDFMTGTIEAEFGQTSENSAALADFSKMLKPAFIKMLKDAVDTRLTTGEWPSADPSEDGTDAENILSRIGVRDLTFREIANLTQNDEERTAEADVIVHQGEADTDFAFKILLTPSEAGEWQVSSIQNLQEYAVLLEKARRLRVEAYLDETDAILARHDQTVRTAQLRLYTVLGAGSLGSQSTRDVARQIMEQEILADWQARREELAAVSVPRSLQSLHQLRLKICDLHAAYAQGYAAWMTDKNAATIRSAENSLRQAEVLEVEASLLVQRAKRSFKME
nr:hypothetical protein [uncultured Selenomonas sp.]